MLPTPPWDTYSEALYGHGSIPTMQSARYTLPAAPRYELARYEDYGYSRQLPQTGVAYPNIRTAHQSEGHSYSSAKKLAQVQSSLQTYCPANAPVLPPIHVPGRLVDESQHSVPSNRTRTVSQQQSKEEKVGGVAAHLDYKMEEMVDFVSETAQGIVMNSKNPIHPEFRRYVNQVLTSTRLPSSTILLGLHYLTVRMTILSARGKYACGGGDVYTLLTTALLLGSKFLDDNTFQNRSWSDVSNISVKKLNALESEWLQDIKWDLHFDPLDTKGFALWRRQWQTFQAATPSNKMDSLAETMKKASIDNSFQRHQTALQPVSSNTRYYASHPEAGAAGHYSEHSTQWRAPQYDQWASVRSPSEYSPPSAPETGPNTPDYTMLNGFSYGALPPTYPSLKMPPPLHILPSNAPAHAYPTAQYNQYLGHGRSCICNYCTSHYDSYTMNYAFDQAVAG